MKRSATPLALALIVVSTFALLEAQRVPVLRDVRAVQVNPTVVSNPDKINEDFAENLMQDSLRNALRNANFETPEGADVRAHIVLDEFSSGSQARRMLVGMGSGHSTVNERVRVSGR
jgi:hypothetical protein